MNDNEEWLQMCYVITVSIVLLFMLSGCALFDSSGQAKYTLDPVIIADGKDKQKAVCCSVQILNSKNIGAVKTHAEYDPQTGKFKVTLEEKEVDSQGPAAAAANAQTDVIKALIPLVK